MNSRMRTAIHPLLSKYQWDQRPLLLFAPREEDERYKLQLAELLQYQAGLWERNVLLFHVFPHSLVMPDGSVLNASESGSLRRHFIIPEKETVALLIGKDGAEKLRSRDLLTSQRLFMTIDELSLKR